MDGALLIDKPPGLSSFGVIESLGRELRAKQGLKRSELPKIGHGGTLDPFATGLLVACVGRGVKLARYFLGSAKSYEGVMRFGETTVPGDPTAPISETSAHLPSSLEELRDLASRLSRQPYSQLPPMHSAKKKNGRPLYELARQGLEVEREPKLCHLYRFEFQDYVPPKATFSLQCSSGTYVRTLAQDFARMLGSVALLETLHRTASGPFPIERATSLNEVLEATQAGIPWSELPCWVRFDDLLLNYGRAEATPEEARALMQGRSSVLFDVLRRSPPVDPESEHSDPPLPIYCGDSLIGIARRENGVWGLERIFNRPEAACSAPDAGASPSMSSPPPPTLWASFSRSQVASSLATVVDFGLLFLLVEGFHVWYVLATALGALAGAIANFVLNRQWSFRAVGEGWQKQAWRYAIVSSGSLALNTGGVYAATDGLGMHYALSVFAVSLLVALTFNFPLQRYFVFRQEKSHEN